MRPQEEIIEQGHTVKSTLVQIGPGLLPHIQQPYGLELW